MTQILKRILNGIRYIDKRYRPKRNSGRSCWVIDDNVPILDWIEFINKRKMARNIVTMDFENLYTTLTHGDILDKCKVLIHDTFSKTGKYLAVSNSNAYWCSTSKNSIFNAQEIINLLSWLLNNAYFTAGNKYYRQTIGIPMGSGCSPFVANLYLYCQELRFYNKHQNKLKYNNTHLTNYFRLIDDITIINDIDNKFLDSFKDIYNNNLNLIKINDNDKEADVLDLTITNDNGKFITKLYDKRKHFPFRAIRLPHYQSNLYMKTKLNTITSQILRIAKITKLKDDFILDFIQLYNDFITQDYPHNVLNTQLLKTLKNNL